MNWKTPITLLVLLAILAGAAYFGWQELVAPTSSETTTPPVTEPTCTKEKSFEKGQRVQAKEVRVNVYNAGSTAGLASDTLGVLTGKGFREGTAGDAPAGVTAVNVTILSDDPNSPEVMLIAQQFQGKVKLAKDDIDAGIDVVVGDEFQAVDILAKTSLVVRRAVRTCVADTPATP